MCTHLQHIFYSVYIFCQYVAPWAIHHPNKYITLIKFSDVFAHTDTCKMYGIKLKDQIIDLGSTC